MLNINQLKVKKNLSDREKLAEILQFLHVNMAEFSKITGIDISHIYNLNSGKINEFSKEALAKIHDAFGELNTEWLVFGQGSMIEDSRRQDSGKPDERHRLVRENLLEAYLNGHPYSGKPGDRRWFLEYAVSCIKDGCDIDIEAMLESGKVSELKIDEMKYAFSWIRNTYEYLNENEQVNTERSDALLVIRLNQEKKDKVFSLLFG